MTQRTAVVAVTLAVVAVLAMTFGWARAVPVGATAPVSAAGTDATVPAGVLAGPTMSLGTTEVALGGRVNVTLEGFRSLWATLSVCGNEAQRGSADCNQTGGLTKEFPTDGSPLRISFAVTQPPVTCPCVIRAVGRDPGEIAMAPIVVTGHPVGPVVDPPVIGPLMRVTIDAVRVDAGAVAALRARLGGPASYEVTVTVTNTSNGDLRDVSLAGEGRRGTDLVATLPYDDPGPIGVGQRWSQTVVVTVPAPSFGEVEWEAVATGAGPSITALSTSSHRPWLLIALVLLVVCNTGLLLVRWRMRRRIEHGELVDAELSPSGGVVAPRGAAAPLDHAAGDERHVAVHR